MKLALLLSLFFVTIVTALACDDQHDTSDTRWVLKSQDNIPSVAPQTYHVCVPAGVTPQNDSLLNTFQPFMALIQFVFEERFSFMEVDWDYNGKGVDYAEKSQTNVVTLLLHDYKGNSYFNWEPISLVRGTVSALVRADKKPLKVIFAIAAIKSPLNAIPGSKEVCDRVLSSKDKTKTPEQSRIFTNWLVFLVAGLGTFFALLSCWSCCILISRKRYYKCQTHDTTPHLEQGDKCPASEKTSDNLNASSVAYMSPFAAQSGPQFWLPQQPMIYTPMVQAQYIQFLPYVTPFAQHQQLQQTQL